MTITDLRVAVTVVSFIVFLGIVVWAMARSKKDLDEAANVPFLEDDAPLADKRQDA